LAGASFYVPFRKVRGWSSVLHEARPSTILLTYAFGVLFGVGSLTFGLTLRYLGMSLGMALAMGNCAVFGTLVPPIFHGQFGQLLARRSGIVTLAGVAVCVLGIVLAGAAGVSKENELSDELKQASVKEFNLKLGVALGIFSGVMSACFAFGLEAGLPISTIAMGHGTGNVWQGLLVMALVLLGSYTTNAAWCLRLGLRNRTLGEYSQVFEGDPKAESKGTKQSGLSVLNYIFCAVAGCIWYLQFFFYSMGTSQLGKYAFSGWTLLMASIIIFSTLWGIAVKEWLGVSRRTTALVALTLVTLVGSTVIVGYGNFLGTH
jgi:L-rhamnose-H+ transport protein